MIFIHRPRFLSQIWRLHKSKMWQCGSFPVCVFITSHTTVNTAYSYVQSLCDVYSTFPIWEHHNAVWSPSRLEQHGSELLLKEAAFMDGLGISMQQRGFIQRGTDENMHRIGRIYFLECMCRISQMMLFEQISQRDSNCIFLFENTHI